MGHGQMGGQGQGASVRRVHVQPPIGCAICATILVTNDTDIHLRAAPKGKPPHIAASKPAARAAVVKSLPQIHTMPTTHPPTPTGTTGTSAAPGVNVFPYGSCTWWADQRYYQLHGTFVPWHTQANAWEWTDRAYQFGWHVSGAPVIGAIIDLQPGVQGASGLGHVGVVEKILSNGHVIASNMSWGAYPWQVTDVEFAPGPGVTFIWQ